MTVPALGIVFTPGQAPESLPALAQAADEWLDELWVWEDCFYQSAIASAATALALTRQVRVGVTLMPAPLRTVGLLAMEIATLHRLFPGRFLPGVGHGVQSFMDQAGVRVASPMTLLTEYADALRRVLDGEEVTVSGRYVTLDKVKLAWPPPPGTPLLMGGQGPRTLDLCARVGDGILLSSGLSPDDVRAVGELVAGPWAQRHAGPAPIVYQLLAATGPDSREQVLRDLPNWGVPAEPARAAFGDARQVAAVIRAAADAGATSVTIQPTLDEPDPAGLARFIGEQVRPLL